MKRYTIIASFRAGPGLYAVEAIRIETDNLKKALRDFDNLWYVFEGWPKQEGETEEPRAGKVGA